MSLTKLHYNYLFTHGRRPIEMKYFDNFFSLVSYTVNRGFLDVYICEKLEL